MANTLSAGIQEHWSKRYQVTHYKVPVYPAVASFEDQAKLKKGDTVHRPYRSRMVARTMGSQGEFTRQDLTDMDESLTIDQEEESSFYIKELDELQNHLPTRDKYARDASIALFNSIEAEAFGLYASYSLTLDDGDFGGTDGNGLSLTVSNVNQVFTKARRLLKRSNTMPEPAARFSGIPKDDRRQSRLVAVISPDFMEVLEEKIEGKETVFGDAIAKNGHVGRYMGFDLFVSNNIAASFTLALATNPTDGDTIVLDNLEDIDEDGTTSVTITFENALSGGSATNEVLIGDTVDDTRDNLAALINESSGDTSTYEDFSTKNRDRVRKITATNVTASDTVTFVAKGAGFVKLSETLTNATDTWTVAKQLQHCLVGMNNSVDVVVQKTPSLRTQPRDGFVGDDVITWAAHGEKVYQEQKKMMVDVQIRTDSYTL